MAGEPEHIVTLVNNTIVNNSIAHSGGSGIRINSWDGKSEITGSNNIIYFNTGDTDQYSSEKGSIKIYYSSVSRAMQGDGNIVDDPMFVNADKDDYSLSAQSPCIDTGDPSLPEDDDNSVSDMGALPFIK